MKFVCCSHDWRFKGIYSDKHVDENLLRYVISSVDLCVSETFKNQQLWLFVKIFAVKNPPLATLGSGS